MKPSYFSHRISTSAAAAAALVLLAAGTSRADLVFDDMSNYEKNVFGASVTTTGSTPNSFMGDAYVLTPGTTDITGFDLYPINLSGTSFTGIKINIFIWGGVNTGTVSAGAPAFSNLLGSYSTTETGAFTSGFFYPDEGAAVGVTPGFTLPSALTIPSTTIGITLNVQGTTDGTTYNNVNSLTSLISYGTAPTVGSEVFNGFFRNANSEVNGNFTSGYRTLGVDDQSLGLRVYGDVTSTPEPTSIALLSAGGLVFFLRRRRTP